MKSEDRFLERKASAENTALWMKADLHRKFDDGAKEVTVNLKDLFEILAYVDSVKARAKMEYEGKRLGFCRPDEMRRLMDGDVSKILVVARKSSTYCTGVSYLEMPPKNPIDVGADIAENGPQDGE